MKEGVSIIICCFNSALLIRKTLEYIAEQKYSGFACEVILVDNASSDSTSFLANQVWAATGNKKIDFRIVFEKMPGLAYARQKGVTESAFEYLIFCDDDNLLDENYVQHTWNLFKMNKQVAILGGYGVAEFEDPLSKPPWFETFADSFALGLLAEQESIVNSVYGAGMAARKSVLEAVLAKQDLFLHGRKGSKLSAGEDSEICYRIRLTGYSILYSPLLTFRHFLIRERLTWPYVKKLHTGFAATFVVLNLYEKALKTGDNDLPSFYWLNRTFYYLVIYLKYWPKHYHAYRKKEGTIEEIRHLIWKNIAKSFFQYNFQTRIMYRNILRLKRRDVSS